MKSDECDRKKIYDIGFNDPVRVNEVLLSTYIKETEANMLRFLQPKHYKKKILFPYNYE